MEADVDPGLAKDIADRITLELRKIIVGQDEIIKLLLVSLFSRGYCLLIGVPGLAKTLLVKSLADVGGFPLRSQGAFRRASQAGGDLDQALGGSLGKEQTEYWSTRRILPSGTRLRCAH